MAANDGMNGLLDPDEVREVLADNFYGRPKTLPARRRRAKKAVADHYKVICISLYNEDLAALDAKVKTLKNAGHRKMSRSALIRYALEHVDLDGLPRSY